MLMLTRLNGHPLAINGDLIKSVESSPDTMITLITGEKIVVLETLPLVLEAARAWRVSILREALALGTTSQQSAATAALAQHAATADSSASANAAHHADPQSQTHRHQK